MGNRLNLRAKFNQMVINLTPATAKIGSNSQCPKCAMHFNSDTTYEMFNNHLQLCLTTPTIVQQTEKFDQMQIYMKEQKQQSEKWTKRLVKINQQIFSLSSYEIKFKTFPEKLAWFYQNMEKHRITWHQGSETIVFEPNHIVRDSIQTFLNIDLHRQLKMSVINDKVSDAGGILREWTSLVLKSLIIDYHLLIPTETDHSVYYLNPSAVIPQNRQLFCFLGGVIGKAIFEKIAVDIYFDHTFLKQLLGQKVQLQDVKSFNSSFHSSWKKILADQNPQQLCLNFAIMKDKKVHQLIENGNNIHVNKANKVKFIDKCIEFYCVTPYQEVMQLIKSNFNKVLPHSLVNIFTPNQFQQIFNGVTVLNLQDWKQGTQYSEGYSEKHKVIQWFWTTLSKMSQQDLKVLLKFVTGCRTLPIFGFKKLEINRGKKGAFTIQPIKYDKKNPLPKSQTCFNRLLLPLYPTQKQLARNLQQLVKIQFEGFWGLQ